MKLKVDIEATKVRAHKLMRDALKSGDKEALAYYEGIVMTLDWVLSGRDTKTAISQYGNTNNI